LQSLQPQSHNLMTRWVEESCHIASSDASRNCLAFEFEMVTPHIENGLPPGARLGGSRFLWHRTSFILELTTYGVQIAVQSRC
jgi:hypothetical protein